MARSMMKEKDLPTKFRGEAIAIAVYLINRCPTKVVCDEIPMEAWSQGRWIVEHPECLDVLHMHMCLRKKGRNWMTRV